MEQVKNTQQEKLQPNYYAIIPANIRYDKNLNSTEKLLYAEITALCDKEGYCWASNNYFAEILNKLPAYISQVLTKLSKKEYITIEIERNNKGTFRKIYIGRVIEKSTEGLQKNLYRGIEKTIEGYRNNYIQKNNTINNTKEYKKEKILKENSKEKNSENFEEEIFEENEIQEIEFLENKNENEKLNNQDQSLEQSQDQTPTITQTSLKKQLQQSDPLYPQFTEIAKRIKQLIETQKRINITNSQLSNWTTEISKLYKTLESARGSENAIYSMFLIINTLNADIDYEDKYKPVIESGKSFREKFIKIEDYYKRRQMKYMRQKRDEDCDDLII